MENLHIKRIKLNFEKDLTELNLKLEKDKLIESFKDFKVTLQSEIITSEYILLPFTIRKNESRYIHTD